VHAGGRPTKYKNIYCQMIIDYFKREPFTQEKIITTYKDGTTKEGIKLIPCNFPTIEGFAVSIGVCHNTVLNWLNDNPRFLSAYNYAKACQKDILTQNGLLGLYNCLFAKFVAINSTDMVDKQEFVNTNTNTNIQIPEGLTEDEYKELFKRKQQEMKNDK
jgi:hypothetical protein